jgi:hypothetical protein
MSGKVSFELTDTHNEPDPTYNLSVNLEGFDSPDSLLARLDQLREIIEVRYRRKIPIGITIENDEDAMPRLQALKQLIEKGSENSSGPDVNDLYYQVEAAIAAVEPAHREQQKGGVRLFQRSPDHPLADPPDEPQ